jgi:tRNA pseudouridine synthase 10
VGGLAALPVPLLAIDREPLFVMGRYNKFVRGVSQTPWAAPEADSLTGREPLKGSLSGLMAEFFVRHGCAEGVVFHAAGREDIDVRMLGPGRPFVMELIGCRRSLSLDCPAIERDVNASTDLIAVHDLRAVSKAQFGLIKDGEVNKRKHYLAKCWTARPLTQADADTLAAYVASLGPKGLVMSQHTPVRVAHRRSLLDRPRSVYTLKMELIDAHNFYLRIITAPGAYVKEFVHGDLGRTYPSLRALIGADTDILELDVEKVELLLPWERPEPGQEDAPAEEVAPDDDVDAM